MIENKQSSSKMKIAIDAMGSDFAPVSEIEGVLLAFKEILNKNDVEIVFVGDESKINACIKNYDMSIASYSILHAEEVVTMHDDPTQALKTKKNSSIYKGIASLKEGTVDAFFSAGNTGAMLTFSTVLLGRIKNVSRPTIGTFFPRIENKPTLIVDAGANAEVKPQFLYEFAIMGSIYSELMFGINKPKVGLLNIGEEETKGTAIVQEAYQLLKASKLNFVGNVEGRDLFFDTADVVVCDGFTGNVVLKFAESIVPFLKSAVKKYSEKSFGKMLKVGLLAPTLKEILIDFDYQQYGGVPLLGVNGVVIIGHGKSSPLAVKNALLRAKESIEKEVNSKIEKALLDLK